MRSAVVHGRRRRFRTRRSRRTRVVDEDALRAHEVRDSWRPRSCRRWRARRVRCSRRCAPRFRRAARRADLLSDRSRASGCSAVAPVSSSRAQARSPTTICSMGLRPSCVCTSVPAAKQLGSRRPHCAPTQGSGARGALPSAAFAAATGSDGAGRGASPSMSGDLPRSEDAAGSPVGAPLSAPFAPATVDTTSKPKRLTASVYLPSFHGSLYGASSVSLNACCSL